MPVTTSQSANTANPVGTVKVRPSQRPVARLAEELRDEARRRAAHGSDEHPSTPRPEDQGAPHEAGNR